MTSTARPLALVTGASAGIGMAYAERLARDGWDLIITGRRRDRLDELSGRLQSEYHSSVEVVAADLATEEGITTIDDLCKQRDLRMLVNNAGLSHYMPFVDLGEDQLRELIQVEVLAPTRHSHSAVREMVKRGRGAVITVSSLLGFSDAAAPPTFPKRAVYASTKAYVLMFSRLLAAELQGTGVKVQVVCPGLVRTEFHSRQGMDMSRVPRLEPDELVQASLIALDNDEVVCIPTLADPSMIAARDEAQASMLLTSLPPTLAERYRSAPVRS